MNCISCHQEHEEKFCPNCGESSSVERITFQSILASAISTVSNMDKGFLYNLKHLTLAPKKTIESFIGGKRKGIYNPIAYAIITISIYLILDSFLDIDEEVVKQASKKRQENFFYQVGYEAAGLFTTGNLKYFWLFNILVLSIFNRLFFKKYNYFEHVTISAFVIGHATIFGTLIFLLFQWPIVLNVLVWLIIILLLYQIFKEAHNKIEITLLSIISGVLSFTFLIFIPVLFVSIKKFYF